MSILILNGSGGEQFIDKDIVSVISTYANNRSKEIKIYNISEHNIAECKGCFLCWVKTPGQCVIIDDMDKISRDLINSDLVIYISPIFCGSYSYLVKKVLDRSIPNISPFFEMVQGEIHHQKRYEKYPDIIYIGISNNESDNSLELFKKLTQRNSINMHNETSNCLIINQNAGSNQVQADISSFLNNYGVHND